MTQTEILAKLTEIVRPYSQESTAMEHVSMETDFIKDLKIDSATLVDVVLDVEDAFGITIDNSAMEKMTNVANTIAVIEDAISRK
ncbi:acyl carrier protein [Flavobacterium aurantiibacter]|uniref:Acyl carrier protein n=1 Tax=Flavobacterium aurantiibacter TaxID=2023067 RepID=A0A255ZQ17_9FLAO|nr:phosphopantetheine-binding protein [Flavobacterium aurantiibacter]OYQ43593.1 acyl carrier protein [Flavobacterium aurantiibacter]